VKELPPRSFLTQLLLLNTAFTAPSQHSFSDTYFRMTSDPDSSHLLPNLDSNSELLPNLDFDLLPRYTDKHLDSLTCSSPHHHTMADLYTTVTGYTHLLFTLMCLISGLASMPFINLCIGGGSIAGTLALSAGVGLLLNSYFRRGFPLHEPPPENEPQAPYQWRVVLYYFLTFALPFAFSSFFVLVLQVSITNCCNFIPAGHTCKPTASDRVPGAARPGADLLALAPVW
jgi:hypothetical protein